jgi:hypothetical protein
MRPFDLNGRPKKIHPKHEQEQSAWFRQGECLRLIEPRELAEQIMRVKAMLTDDEPPP